MNLESHSKKGWTKAQCYALYLEGYTLEEIAAKTGYSTGTIKNYSRKDNWVQKRKEQTKLISTETSEVIRLKVARVADKIAKDLLDAHLKNMAELSSTIEDANTRPKDRAEIAVKLQGLIDGYIGEPSQTMRLEVETSRQTAERLDNIANLFAKGMKQEIETEEDEED